MPGHLWQSHEAVKNLVGSLTDQSDFSCESLEVKAAWMTGAVIYIAGFNIGRQSSIKAEVITIDM